MISMGYDIEIYECDMGESRDWKNEIKKLKTYSKIGRLDGSCTLTKEDIEYFKSSMSDWYFRDYELIRKCLFLLRDELRGDMLLRGEDGALFGFRIEDNKLYELKVRTVIEKATEVKI